MMRWLYATVLLALLALGDPTDARACTSTSFCDTSSNTTATIEGENSSYGAGILGTSTGSGSTTGPGVLGQMLSTSTQCENLLGTCGGVVGESSNEYFPAVFGASNSPGVGIIGTSLPGSVSYNQDIVAMGIGVYGEGYYGAGVYGASDSASGAPGVFGISGSASNCITGYSGCGVGVQGASYNGTAVQGEDAASGYGVYGSSVDYIGVYGSSVDNTGVYGTTSSAAGYGVYGANNSYLGTAVYGYADGSLEEEWS